METTIALKPDDQSLAFFIRVHHGRGGLRGQVIAVGSTRC